MSVDDDLRELRAMHMKHLEEEGKMFIATAEFHGELRLWMKMIEQRLETGDDSFGENEQKDKDIDARLQKVEGVLSNWKFFGGSIAKIVIVVTGVVEIGVIFGGRIWRFLSGQ